jgi:cephalosporin hydroxylase
MPIPTEVTTNDCHHRARSLRVGYSPLDAKNRGVPSKGSFQSAPYGLDFTNRWFDNNARDVWNEVIPQINPTTVLEIGSYEGASTCYLIDSLAKRKAIEIHCVDTWGGGIEHESLGIDMLAVEKRFLSNTNQCISGSTFPVRLVRHKGRSDVELAKLVSSDKLGYFDFIYVDGSHQAPDVICDAVLSFRLLKLGGVIAFDDYLWSEEPAYGTDPLRCPKLAIDAFTTIFARKTRILHAPLYQMYVKKTSE